MPTRRPWCQSAFDSLDPLGLPVVDRLGLPVLDRLSLPVFDRLGLTVFDRLGLPVFDRLGPTDDSVAHLRGHFFLNKMPAANEGH